jgi:hypothetical protein
MTPRTHDSGATTLRRPSRRTILRASVPAAVALAGGTAWVGTTAFAQDGPTDTELAIELTARVKDYLATTGTQTQASVVVTRSTRSVTTNKSRIHDTASLVKMEILAMLLEKYSTAAAIPAAKKDQARLMITQSHNDSATALYNFLGGCDALAAAHKRYGMTNTKPSADCRWGLTTTTVVDQMKILGHLLYAGYFPQEKVNYARGLMGAVVSSQDWGVKAAAHRPRTGPASPTPGSRSSNGSSRSTERAQRTEAAIAQSRSRTLLRANASGPAAGPARSIRCGPALSRAGRSLCSAPQSPTSRSATAAASGVPQVR